MPARAWGLGGVAAALAIVVVGLLAWARGPLEGAGFERRVFEGESCEGSSSSAIVREPFAPEAARGDGRCVQWTAQMVAWTQMRARVELTSEPGGTVVIDGRPVVTDEGTHPARTRSGAVDLARGVHSFTVTHTSEAGTPDYLRVALADDFAPHNYEFAPPLDGDAFFTTSAAASRALQSRSVPPAEDDSPSSDRAALPAYVGCFALVGLVVVAWLGLRVRRGKAIPWNDVALGAALFVAAFAVRARGIAAEGDAWDERVYVDAAAHWVRNLALHDFHVDAWRYNLTHPPDTKWALAFGVALAGHTGARVVAATESALAVAILFAFGRVVFDRATGILAAALAVVLPLWVAYGRIAGHESNVLFWWSASMLGLACWLDSLPPRDGGTPLERGDSVAAFACGFSAAIGLWSRANVLWIFPLLAAVFLWRGRTYLARGVIALPLGVVLGVIAGTLLTSVAWPYLWARPYEQATQLAYYVGVGKPKRDFEVYLGKLTAPAWHYFAFAFVAETPALLLVLAAAGAVIAFRSPSRRAAAVVCAMWLFFPFLQTLGAVRIGAARYVSQAWPALLLFAAIALVAAGQRLATLVDARRPRARLVAKGAPALLALLYAAVVLVWIEPYPLDYFSEVVGGPKGVASRRTFEVPWWGEGNLAAVRALDESAPPGARVFLALWPKHVVARLRDDMVRVPDAASADYVLVSRLQYFERPPAGCALRQTITAAGAPLVDTYECPRREP